MANKYFLGSVGKAEAFRKDADGNLRLAFVSKTLTDSGLNISTTKDDIRAGQGAPIQFSFYHDPSVEITLTDVLWKPEYLTAQLGAEFENGSEDYITDEVTFAAGEASTSKPTTSSFQLRLSITSMILSNFPPIASQSSDVEARAVPARDIVWLELIFIENSCAPLSWKRGTSNVI